MDAFAGRFVRAFSALKGGEIHLNVDCAHGVGALALTSLSARLHLEFSRPSYPAGSPQICIRTFNTLTNDKQLLNKDCGADYVKVGMANSLTKSMLLKGRN